MSALFINHHRGLGDHLVCNAIVRDHAAKFSCVYLPCKAHNVPSVAFMFRDLPNVEVVPVRDDNHAIFLTHHHANRGGEVLGLGMFGEKPFNINRWDEEMYRQAGVPFSDRWDKFHVERCPEREAMTPVGPFVLCHDDVSRHFIISSGRLPFGMTVVRPAPTITDSTLFAWWKCIEQAQEIHCIDSAFAIWADSVPTQAKRHVLHLYARPGAKPPQYRKNWEILR